MLGLYGNNDMRYNSYFYSMQTGYAHGLVWPMLFKYFGNQDFISSALLYHVSMPKPFRLAEQYLIRAEAYCRKASPNFAAASADLSALRSQRIASGGGINLTADNYIDHIADERVRELYMEGFRLNDLKRWKMGFERTPQAQSQSEGSSIKIAADDPLYVWPIPNHEIESPGSSIQPNESNR